MDSPSFSIIIPAYNCKQYIEACLDSILLSNLCDDEIILIDDGSDDGTGEICDTIAYCHRNIRTFHSNHIGVAEARNIGIKNATKEYILFVDGDDCWIPSFRLTTLRRLISKREDDFYIFGYHIRNTRYDTESDLLMQMPSLSFKNWRDNPDSFLDCFNNGVMFPCWNKVFKNSIIAKYALFFHQQQMEDFLFVLDYLNTIQSVSYIPIEPYVYYRRKTGSSLTDNMYLDMLEGYNACHQRFLTSFDSDYSNKVHQIMAPQYIATVNRCLHQRDITLSHHILNGIKHNTLGQLSLRAYKPTSTSERFSIFLMKKGSYRMLTSYRKIANTFKRFLF